MSSGDGWFRVATLNIRGARPEGARRPDLPGLARALAALEADLVGLQEVRRFLPVAGGLQDQPRRLARQLGRRVTFRRSFGVGPVGYGNAVVSAARPVAVRCVRLPGGREPRSALLADFVLPDGAVRLVVTHLGLGAAERAAQVEALARLVRAARCPVILAGDLNAPPDAPELVRLTGQALLHAVPPDLPTCPASAPTRRLDYLLHTPDLEAVGGRVVAAAVSDHLPVVADFRFRLARGG